MLSREFDMPDTLRIWDTIFAQKNKLEYLLYICASMVYHIQDYILSHDFGENISFYTLKNNFSFSLIFIIKYITTISTQ